MYTVYRLHEVLAKKALSAQLHRCRSCFVYPSVSKMTNIPTQRCCYIGHLRLLKGQKCQESRHQYRQSRMKPTCWCQPMHHPRSSRCRSLCLSQPSFNILAFFYMFTAYAYFKCDCTYDMCVPLILYVCTHVANFGKENDF